MRKLGGIILLSALGLAGCAAPAVSDPAPTTTVTATATAAPISARSIPTPASQASIGPVEDVALFLKSAKSRWVGTPPADDALIGAGTLACQEMRSGTDVTAVKVVDSSRDKDQSLAIAVAAQDGLCPETIPKG
jgi:hypothetical protein